MALFNKLKRVTKRTVNKAGGEAFIQSPEMQLASILLTSFAQDQFYRSSKQTFKELIALLEKVDPLFAAKAAIYARNEFGMRSITHVLAGELAKHVSGKDWAKYFYREIVRRPDDMLEIMAYFYGKGNTKLPNAMKKGFAASFDKFDSYQLAKYRGEQKSVKLVDAVNLIHPSPTNRNAEALNKLVKGKLKSTDTWESKLTKAGQQAASVSEKDALKAEAWKELLTTNRLGYFALLRNLRNIAEQAPQLVDLACQQLTDEHQIKKSLVMPFRYLTAVDAIKGANISTDKVSRKIETALHNALEISLSNVPAFDGSTLVVLDDSGSMTHKSNRQINRTPIQIAAIFAAVLYKSNDADLMRFSSSASYLTPYFGDSAISIADLLVRSARAGGTNFHDIFKKANKAYDRIIILSDMQGWMGGHSPKSAFEDYKRRTNASPFVYSFDLQGYGSLQFPENQVFCLSGFSEKVFDIMALLEQDRNALVNSIKKTDFSLKR